MPHHYRSAPRLVALVAVSAALLVVADRGTRGLDLRSEGEIEIAAGEVVEDDLYVFGDTVVIAGTVRGDLVGAARFIDIQGTVEGDVLVAAQAVRITGQVRDDIRFAGQVLQIGEGAVVDDDVLAAGFSLEVMSSVSAGGSLAFTGYQARLAGDVGEDLRAACQSLEIAGRIGGNVMAEVEGSPGYGFSPATFFPMLFQDSPIEPATVTAGLSIEAGAEVLGDVEYRSTQLARVDDAAIVGGEIEREAPVVDEESVEEEPESPLWDRVQRFLVLLLVGVLLAVVAPKWLGNRARRLRDRTLPSFGWGFLGVAGFGFAAVLLLGLAIALASLLAAVRLGSLSPMIVLSAIVLSFALILLLVIGLVYLAQVVFAVAVGSWLVEKVRRGDRPTLLVAVVLGLVVFVLVRAIPYLGWWFGFIVGLIGFGTIVTWLFDALPHRSGGAGDADADDSVTPEPATT